MPKFPLEFQRRMTWLIRRTRSSAFARQVGALWLMKAVKGNNYHKRCSNCAIFPSLHNPSQTIPCWKFGSRPQKLSMSIGLCQSELSIRFDRRSQKISEAERVNVLSFNKLIDVLHGELSAFRVARFHPVTFAFRASNFMQIWFKE